MYDLAVIGGGPGGYVAAIRGAQMGLKVLLVEKDALGGTCLNRGCVPTKCFIYDTKLYEAVRSSPVMTGADALSIDMGRMVSRKRQVVKTLVSGVGAIVKSHGVEVAAGRGILTAPGLLQMTYSDGSAEEVKAANVIIATGSKPGVPPFIGVDGHLVQTTDDALDTETVPQRPVIIGGGVIGMEMAAVYLNLGCHVTILELLPDILMTEDADIRRAMRMLLDQRGAEVHCGARAKEVIRKGETVEITYEDQKKTVRSVTTDRLLVATGRSPVLDGIDTRKLGIKLDGPFIRVDSRLQTSIPGIYAIGDVTGGMMLAHKASAEAEAAVANIMGRNRLVDSRMIPRCIWALSEVGSVGLTEEEARASGRPVRTGKFSYVNSGAAQAMGNMNGFVKIVGDPQSGEILGVHIMGEHATDLVGESVLAMTMEGAVEDLAGCIKPHPTLSETVMEAAMDWSDSAVHSLKKG